MAPVKPLLVIWKGTRLGGLLQLFGICSMGEPRAQVQPEPADKGSLAESGWQLEGDDVAFLSVGSGNLGENGYDFRSRDEVGWAEQGEQCVP